MKNTRLNAALLILGALGGVMVMLHHPHAGPLIAAGGSGRLARLNVLLHGLAILVTPAVFLGLLGVVRALEWPDLGVAALVAFGFGGVAVIGAAIASGFVATGVIQHAAAGGAGGHDALLFYTGLWNQGFATVNVVADAAGMVLLSLAILRSRRIGRLSGFVGVLIGAAILIAFYAGRLALDVHGFGLVTFGRSLWLSALGALSARTRRPAAPQA